MAAFHYCRIPYGTCEKVASDLGLGGGFQRVLRFLLQFSTGQSRFILNVGER